MSKPSAGRDFIAGLSAVTYAAGRSQVPPVCPPGCQGAWKAWEEAPYEVQDIIREAVDAWFLVERDGLMVPKDWDVYQHAAEEVARISEDTNYSIYDIQDWIGLSDYLNARLGRDLRYPKTVSSIGPFTLIKSYLSNVWIPKYGLRAYKCLTKYSAAIGEYISMACYPIPFYPIAYGGQIKQKFADMIGKMEPYFNEISPTEYMRPDIMALSPEKRAEREAERERLADILSEGYARVQYENQRRMLWEDIIRGILSWSWLIWLPLLAEFVSG